METFKDVRFIVVVSHFSIFLRLLQSCNIAAHQQTNWHWLTYFSFLLLFSFSCRWVTHGVRLTFFSRSSCPSISRRRPEGTHGWIHWSVTPAGILTCVRHGHDGDYTTYVWGCQHVVIQTSASPSSRASSVVICQSIYWTPLLRVHCVFSVCWCGASTPTSRGSHLERKCANLVGIGHATAKQHTHRMRLNTMWIQLK